MFIPEERSELNAPAVADPSSSLFEHECERAQLRASMRSQAGETGTPQARLQGPQLGARRGLGIRALSKGGLPRAVYVVPRGH